jgi:hypothetical protein
VAARITGSGAKNLAVMLYAVMRDQQRTKGKVRMESMLRSGKELKVFTLRRSDLAVFCQEAKRYGVLYCVVKDKDPAAGAADILVRAEDASKINRIIERFGLSSVAAPDREPEEPEQNPTRSRDMRRSQSVRTSGRRDRTGTFSDDMDNRRPSVRQTLRELRQAREWLSPVWELGDREAR